LERYVERNAMPKPFQKGNKFGIKGCPPGAHHIGRPPNLFKEQLEKALVEARDIELVQAIISGVAFPRVINKDGEVVEIEATPKERLEAIKMGWEYLYGKADQRLEVTGANGDPLPGIPASDASELAAAIRRRLASDSGTKA
jgi:hypothetical protein